MAQCNKDININFPYNTVRFCPNCERILDYDICNHKWYCFSDKCNRSYTENELNEWKERKG